mmetsp:Transcript_44437/g.134699  ORF Transcript_44437/g.134699 Transcript_44437/m.134699 type:complete len:217 (+) Transcript_44437:1361-2011(+)
MLPVSLEPSSVSSSLAPLSTIPFTSDTAALNPLIFAFMTSALRSAVLPAPAWILATSFASASAKSSAFLAIAWRALANFSLASASASDFCPRASPFKRLMQLSTTRLKPPRSCVSRCKLLWSASADRDVTPWLRRFVFNCLYAGASSRKLRPHSTKALSLAPSEPTRTLTSSASAPWPPAPGSTLATSAAATSTPSLRTEMSTSAKLPSSAKPFST